METDQDTMDLFAGPELQTLNIEDSPGSPSGNESSYNLPSNGPSTHHSPSGGTTTNASATNGKTIRILACVLCQTRKIKCDRSFPCVNCLKAGVTCTPSKPAPARKRRRPNQDLQERLARCESLLKQYATTSQVEPPTPDEAQDSNPPSKDIYENYKPPVKLVEDKGGVHLVDSVFLGTVYDELRSMRQMLKDDPATTDDCYPGDGDSSPADDSEIFFGGSDAATTNAQPLSPSPQHILRLWQIFLERVNPLTKIIHAPTMQPHVIAAAQGLPTNSMSIQILLFSIYTFTIVSMSHDECTSVFGASRPRLLARYSRGTRTLLTRIDFMRTHDLPTLQGLTLYIMSLQGRYDRHAAWILSGVAVRIAQKMGMHKDGTLIGLSPFETEMRRRLWWQLVLTDAKFAMASGTSHAMLPRNWDTLLPKNVDDADLDPNQIDPVEDSDKPTDMVFCLITYQLASFIVKSTGLQTMLLLKELTIIDHTDVSNSFNLAKSAQTVQSMSNVMEVILSKYSSDDAGELHQLARRMKDYLVNKISGLINLPVRTAGLGVDKSAHEDNAFVLAVTTTEHSTSQYRAMQHPKWDWFGRMHFQFDFFVYVIGQLRTRLSGDLVEQAWVVTEGVYATHPAFYEMQEKAHLQLAQLVLSTWKKRVEYLFDKNGTAPPTPFYILKLESLVAVEMYKDVKRDRNGTGTCEASPSDVLLDTELDAAFGNQIMPEFVDYNSMPVDMSMWGAAPLPLPPVMGGNQFGYATPWSTSLQTEW